MNGISQIFDENERIMGYYNKFINFAIILSLVIYVFSGKIDGRLEEMGEITFSIIFLLDYVISILKAKNKPKYIFSFEGIIDLLSIGLISVLKSLKFLRILKFTNRNNTILIIKQAWSQNRFILHPIVAIIFSVVMLGGTLLYLIESNSGNTSYLYVFDGLYNVFVSITTVGFGDIYPKSDVGKLLISLLIVLGHSCFVIIPTILSVSIVKLFQDKNKLNDHESEKE
jgi:voltage-gated potassium channel